MIIELQKLLQGIVDTLDQEVGPHVEAGPARAQFYSSLDLLNNLAAKLDWNQQMLTTEIESVEGTLRSVQPVLEKVADTSDGLAKARDAMGVVLETPAPGPDEGGLVARRRDCNQVLEDTIAAVNAPDVDFASDVDEVLEEVRGIIHAHLVNQTIIDAMYLKPMMLTKISQA